MGFCPGRHQTYLANDKGVPTGGRNSAMIKYPLLLLLLYTHLYTFLVLFHAMTKNNCPSVEVAVAKVQLGDNDLN
jgi:hypothetical protein